MASRSPCPRGGTGAGPPTLPRSPAAFQQFGGLSLLFRTPLGDGLNRGLTLLPVADVVGGLAIGVGMAIARSCVSVLFYKLGAGMLGAGRRGAPLAVGWRRTGLALGAATLAGWVLAALGGVDLGPSTVGAVSGAARGTPNWWLIAFLVGLVLGAGIAARTAGGLWVRGESPVRYRQLALGGLLLGAGGWVAGGCDLGHGLSGAAQLNVSSWVVVASIVAGIGLTGVVQRRRGRPAGVSAAQQGKVRDRHVVVGVSTLAGC